ncbi:PTS sugar transporter subunit IIC [Lactobacillus corticis]|uniref:Permease IIC component n=1 Tax=Lactobacillus corticis TaxID=2201249 RepID=A0A916VHJ8_9LACO|nr:PTS transporter subunit EIIC [Lactobacillus corticis]GFZ26250.1 cellobiose-specific PTS system IIC component [Lactobacillus corticis]
MNRLVKFLEDYFLPLANAIGRIRWLVAIRNAFISMLPITMSGSLAVAVPSLVKVAKNQLGWTTFAFFMQPLVAISNVVWRGTFALFSVYLALALGYQLAKTFEANRLAGAIISLASFAMSVSNYVVLGKSKHIIIEQAFDLKQLDSSGIFTAIIFGGIGFAIYLLCYQARLVIRLSSSTLHSEQAAFESLLPGMIAIITVGGLNYLFQSIFHTYFGTWLLNTIQRPLVNIGQGFGFVLLVTFLISVFSFFGLNGLSVLAPMLDSIWLTAQNANIAAARHGKVVPYVWTRSSFDVFAWYGGAGGTLILVIAILLFAKRTDLQAVAKVAIAPSFFNIGEPILFGLPVVFNPVYLIPFIVAPMVNVAVAYAVSVMGLVNPVQVAVPSIMPSILSAWLATNYDWRAIVLVLVNMVIALLIWLPFVKAADRMEGDRSRSFFATQY